MIAGFLGFPARMHKLCDLILFSLWRSATLSDGAAKERRDVSCVEWCWQAPGWPPTPRAHLLLTHIMRCFGRCCGWDGDTRVRAALMKLLADIYRPIKRSMLRQPAAKTFSAAFLIRTIHFAGAHHFPTHSCISADHFAAAHDTLSVSTYTLL